MAVTSIHSIKATYWATIRYITDGDKTVNGLYVQSYACRSDSAGASEDFRTVRNNGTGRTRILAHHIIQSFEHGEITPEKALQVSEELCDKFLQGDYQYVLAVHTDKEHIHSHIIFNNTNLYSGLSFTTEHNQGKVKERAWAKLRQISDDICEKHGLSVIKEPEKGQGISHFEHEHEKLGTSWKAKLRELISEIIAYSKDFDDFLRNCENSGIEAVYTPHAKNKLKFRMQGQARYTRAKTLGEKFEPDNILSAIEANRSKQNSLAKTNEKIKAESSKQSDKDVWASIRGMRNSDEIIRNLEAAGITLFADFSTFMWNMRHNDDHTEELDRLQKEFTAIDKLTEKMKHREKLLPVYKEYRNLSGWKQKRFRKRNAIDIDDFEKTNAYIKRHIQDYDLPGNTNKIIELQSLSIELKEKFNALVSEHNAFLIRKAAAVQYTKVIRQYLHKQKTEESKEQSRDRTYNRQKDKQTLE